MAEQCRSLENGTPMRCEHDDGHQGSHSFDVQEPRGQVTCDERSIPHEANTHTQQSPSAMCRDPRPLLEVVEEAITEFGVYPRDPAQLAAAIVAKLEELS